ncbi:hypothetical protein [Thalassococcus sp. S3]|uniref:hypothetical protein n=1 Tax=Thalassococcus sp. S3 TaxID=2017482 RepID=UPI00102BEC06|nr:hypothetical protein [Thalassococcus sp. S3]
MTDLQGTVLDSLRDVGLGPQRIDRAAGGETLFGTGGLLNSIELVQFVAALSERTGVDAFDFMENFQGGTGVFSTVETILDFLEGRRVQAMAS